MSIELFSFEKYDEIVFGPFIGEFGWEIMRWAGFARYYKRKYYNKKRIIVSTRSSREDLYYGCIKYIELFNIEGDYDKYKPNCYNCENLPEEMYSNLVEQLRDKYPNAYIFDPRVYKCAKDIFDFNLMDFNFTPKIVNSTIIDRIIEKSPGRIPIVIAPRDRKDITYRNWGSSRWKTLFDMIGNSEKYLVFVSGMSPSFYKAADYREHFHNLEDYVSDQIGTTDVGLTIDAIRKSKLTVGSQSAAIILSNLLQTPTLFWGDMIKRHAVIENPRKTLSYGIEDRNYGVDPIVIYGHIKRMTK